MLPAFPVYIPTKGRSKFMVTSKALAALGVPHFLVVEAHQIPEYREAVAALNLPCTILELDPAFKDRYELCDGLGLSKSTGPGPARNFAWEHARSLGAAWHWVMDDNIKAFFRLNRNLKVPVSDATIFAVMENFVLRYRNVGMAGPNYFMFASRKYKLPPFVMNTRIYSCNLIRNDLPFRWRGRYNEDTILSLDMLKANWVTIQFNAFLQDKMETQKLPGGNTDEFYLVEGKKQAGSKYADKGTLAKSQMLADVHPDVARVTFGDRRFKRIHHHVDYGGFVQRLVRRPGVDIPAGVNDFGMRLVAFEG